MKVKLHLSGTPYRILLDNEFESDDIVGMVQYSDIINEKEKWDKENMSVLGCKVKKEQAEKFKAYCESMGKTSNAVLRDYVLDCIDEKEAGEP